MTCRMVNDAVEYQNRASANPRLGTTTVVNLELVNGLSNH